MSGFQTLFCSATFFQCLLRCCKGGKAGGRKMKSEAKYGVRCKSGFNQVPCGAAG